MELALMTLIALNFAGATVFQKVADDAVDRLWDKVRVRFKKGFGREPDPGDFILDSAAVSELDAEVIKDALRLVERSAVLRRVRLVTPVFQGARVLWVDDVPTSIAYEAALLRALGSEIDEVFTTEEAIARIRSGGYDLVISDMERLDNTKAGLELLPSLQGRAAPGLVFYIANLDQSRDRPAGSYGITNRPDELLHLVMDVLERRRA